MLVVEDSCIHFHLHFSIQSMAVKFLSVFTVAYYLSFMELCTFTVLLFTICTEVCTYHMVPCFGYTQRSFEVKIIVHY